MARSGRKQAGPQFVRFFGPVINALKDLGGSGRPSEVEDRVFTMMGISDHEQSEQLKGGGSRLSNQVHWARFYLTKGGYVDSSTRGVWSLTEKGRQTVMSQQEALSFFKSIQQQVRSEQGTEDQPTTLTTSSEEFEVVTVIPERAHRTALMALLQSLPPAGFERLCQRILREAGLTIEITGRSGDGGIDGHGVLQVNPFVSFQVHIQCKRYSQPVGAEIIRNFRGAMEGRADKGIILTTSTFTEPARKEAARDGARPIELIDGEKLLNIFESYELGLVKKAAYDIDEAFFSAFRS